MQVWHPTATRKYYSLRGKPWIGGDATKPKVLLHTTETLGMPNYSAPPHMTFFAQRTTRDLYQHIGFDKAAYSVRDNALEDDKFTYQVEIIGYAAKVPGYLDLFYQNLAWLLLWFNKEMGVPLEFADFSVMNEVYAEFFPVDAEPPARITLGVPELAFGASVEIECTATR